ncbi:MAG TPA: hypothetical protein VJU16_01305 [Planctomycetota bacterium]|nr:hypothetical protein [Planctomycetota bacterium]
MKRFALAVLCVGIFAALCWDATQRLAEAYPTVFTCQADPLKYEGKPVWMNPSEVVTSFPAFFEVQYFHKWVRVHSNLHPRLGTRVMVHGRFRIDGTVEAIACAEDNDFTMNRRGVLIVSILVLAAGVYVFRSAFAWRDWAFHPRHG